MATATDGRHIRNGFYASPASRVRALPSYRPYWSAVPVFWILCFPYVFGCSASKNSDAVSNPSAPPRPPVDEESVEISERQQARALETVRRAGITNDLVRQLLSPENRKDAYARLAERAGKPVRFEDDLPYDPIAKVVICPQSEGPPLFAVFHRTPRNDGSFFSTGFDLIDSDGAFHPIYSNANVADGVFQDINGDTVVDKVDDHLITFHDYRYWLRKLAVVPMTPSPQKPTLIILMNPVGWTWRSEVTSNPDIMKIHIGPTPGDGATMTPSATYVWDATQKSFKGPDGGVGYPYMRVSALDDLESNETITRFAAPFPHPEGYPSHGEITSETSPSSDIGAPSGAATSPTTDAPPAAEVRTETGSSVTMPNGVVVYPKTEFQRFNSVCSARRTWIEFGQLADQKVADKINRRIRKTITVGKLLTPQDCVEPEDNEEYEYMNETRLSGSWGNFVGLHTSVIFPGGSGRVASLCAVVDLQSGRQYELAVLLKDAEMERLRERWRQQARKDDVSEDSFADLTYCLDNQGIKLVLYPDSATSAVSSEMLIPYAEVSTFFDLPAELLKAGRK